MKNIVLFFSVLFVVNVYNSYSQSLTSFVYVEGGKFKMGSKNGDKDEFPIHNVKVNDFYILNHEVTNEEFAEFLNSEGNQFESHSIWLDYSQSWNEEPCRIYLNDSVYYVEKGYENYPVAFVDWYGAQRFCEWIGGRLPTEAEWEYFAKKSIENIIFTESVMSNYAVFEENSGNIYSPTASKNSLNHVFDLFGNMTEWCFDWYSKDYYKLKEKNNPQGPDLGVQKVIRGGSWATKIISINPTNRRATSAINHNITIGFRVVIPCK